MYLKMAWRNIWRNKRRTIITLASIGFAVFFSSLMNALQLGSYGNMIDNAVRFYSGYIQIHQKGYWDDKSINNTLADADSLHQIIAAEEGVKTIVPRLESFALASHGKQTKGSLVVGISPEAEQQLTGLRDKMQEGEYLQDDDQQVLVAQGLADYLNIGVGDTLVLIGQGYHGINAAGKYAVKGIVKFPLPEFNNQSVYLPLKEAQWLYGADNMLTALALVLEDPESTEAIVASLSTKLDDEAYEVMGWRTMMPELVQGIELDYTSGKILLFILYAIIAFGLFGTFLMMTNERMYEFGVLVAVGMKRRILQFIMLLETIMMGLSGVLAGVIFSSPIIIYMHYNPVRITGEMAASYEKFGMEPIIPFSMDPIIFLNQAWVVLVMTVLLSLYPMWIIFRLKAVEAMRD